MKRFCPNCAKEIPVDAVKCPNCGFDIIDYKLQCPKCAKEIPIHTEKCPFCGYDCNGIVNL